MLLLSAWSTNGWLPSGHAMRMALDLGLHRALEKLADGGAKGRTNEEERDLGASDNFVCSFPGSFSTSISKLSPPGYGCVSTGLIISKLRCTLHLQTRVICHTRCHFFRMSLGTGRPIVLRDENSIRHCRLLLNHPMASPTDVRLVSQIELIAQKSVQMSS